MLSRFTLFVLICCCTSSNIFAQRADTSKTYPYVLPIWGQKAQDRGYADQLQLPFGLNINYVNAFVDLEITEFQLLVGSNDLTGILNTETLNFTDVNATTNGVNLRADAWILPFLNVYGLFSAVKGGTNVALQPTWKNALGEIILQLPEFSSQVNFDALAYGAGMTTIFGWDNYFSSIDINLSRTQTELLKNQIGYLTLSGRVGRRFALNKTNKDFFVAPYIGIMHRNFVGARGSEGNIGLDEVFPNLDQSFNDRIDTKIVENEDKINDPSTPIGERIKLQAQNQALNTIKKGVNDSGLFKAKIDYYIKKELIQTLTFQFGFNLQINKQWMVRGEYGVADSQRFLMTGVQYRFGVRKKSMRL